MNTSRTVPGYLNIMGTATNTATVSLWSKESTAVYTPTSRKGEYFCKQLTVANTSAPVWQQVDVTATGETSVRGSVLEM